MNDLDSSGQLFPVPNFRQYLHFARHDDQVVASFLYSRNVTTWACHCELQAQQSFNLQIGDCFGLRPRHDMRLLVTSKFAVEVRGSESAQ